MYAKKFLNSLWPSVVSHDTCSAGVLASDYLMYKVIKFGISVVFKSLIIHVYERSRPFFASRVNGMLVPCSFVREISKLLKFFT